MIQSNDQLAIAERAVAQLKQVLIRARDTHGTREYLAMSEPILIEIQQREQEILQYLSKSKAELAAR